MLSMYVMTAMGLVQILSGMTIWMHLNPKVWNQSQTLNKTLHRLPVSKDWESNSTLPIDKVVANLPGPKPLTTMQGSTSKTPVQDARNSPEVPIPDTGGLLGEMHEFSNESYSKLPQSPGRGTEPEEAPNT
ncbi:hypothetical protein DSO57_1022849 [Entomophthora muscae]|uniref:Uncharacterized protein n=1 Tax=Entomophthora muscae TaxID=34485 RepID=A0ACC2S562_9FUNG|nr:hypothetical protein DSO57_1022849 [Entomophthora muscae]